MAGMNTILGRERGWPVQAKPGLKARDPAGGGVEPRFGDPQRRLEGIPQPDWRDQYGAGVTPQLYVRLEI